MVPPILVWFGLFLYVQNVDRKLRTLESAMADPASRSKD